MTCGIYSIQSPNGKLYIGSSINIERRWKEYNKLKCKSQKHLYSSLVKYGVDTHTFQVIWECSEEELLDKEQMLMNFYKPELNLCKIAGKPPSPKGKIRGGWKLSEETKKKMSQPRTQEHRQNISNALKGKSPFKGKTHSEETKRKISEARIKHEKEKEFR